MKHQNYTVIKASGGSDPDPAIYCPAHGYLPPESDGTYTPPVDIGIPTTEEIRLLCTNQQPSLLRLTASGAYNVKVIDSTDTTILDQNKTSGSYFTYTFTETDPIQLFVVKITPQSGQSLTTFRTYPSTSTGYFAEYMRILQAKFYTPNITNLASAFTGVKDLKEVLFYSTLDNVTIMANFISGTGVEKFIMPPSIGSTAAAATNLSYFADGSLIKTFDFNNCDLPKCTNMSYFFRSTPLVNLTLNFNAPLLVDMSYFFWGCFKYKNVDLSVLVLKDTNSPMQCDYMFYYMTVVEEIKMFETDISNADYVTLDTNYLLNAVPALKRFYYKGKIKITGFASFHNVASNIPSPYFDLCEAAPDMIIDCLNPWGNTGCSPKTLSLPALVTTTLNKSIIDAPGTGKTMMLIGEMTNSDATLQALDLGSPYVADFYHPNLKVKTLRLGVAGGSLATVEVDWANSFTDATHTAGTTILYLYGNLSTAETERIFTALPILTVSGKITGSGTGYNAADKTIATAKGWIF